MPLLRVLFISFQFTVSIWPQLGSLALGKNHIWVSVCSCVSSHNHGLVSKWIDSFRSTIPWGNKGLNVFNLRRAENINSFIKPLWFVLTMVVLLIHIYHCLLHWAFNMTFDLSKLWFNFYQEVVSSDLPQTLNFLSDVTQLKEELCCHSINKLLYNSLCTFFLTFIVTGNSKINCPKKSNPLPKRLINVFTAKSLIYTGQSLPVRCISHSEKSVFGKWGQLRGRGCVLSLA